MSKLSGLEIAGLVLGGAAGAFVVERILAGLKAPAPSAAATTPSLQVGDAVVLPNGTFEGVDREDALVDDAANVTAIEARMTAADRTVLENLFSSPGMVNFPVEFEVTKTGLSAPGGTLKGAPVLLGVLKTPAVSVRVPFVLPLGAVMSARRNGQPLAVAPPSVTHASLSARDVSMDEISAHLDALAQQGTGP